MSAPPPMVSVQELFDKLAEANETIKKQQNFIAELASEALVLGTVVSANHFVRPDAFGKGDRIEVIDPDSPFFGRVGQIYSNGVDLATGCVRCEFYGEKSHPHFSVGLRDVINPETNQPKPKQVQLLLKNDGTNVVVAIDDGLIEAINRANLNPSPGDIAKVLKQSNQIVEVTPPSGTGKIVTVVGVVGENQIEVSVDGNPKIVVCHKPAEEGDKVIVDDYGFVVTKVLSANKDRRYKLRKESIITWDDIGGQEAAKRQIREMVVEPFTNKDVFDYYDKETRAGFLLHGPPGCGKTLLGKALANQLAALHGKELADSGFNYVKGPEILSKYVGEPEAETRALFGRMRRHWERYGYPAVTFFDECDAVFAERKSSNNAIWHDQLVAMWLAEMDGLDGNEGILVFATNRPKSLDSAILRPGRLDYHIKVDRPGRAETKHILGLHMKNAPLKDWNIGDFSEYVAADIFDNPRPLFKVVDKATNRQHIFTLADSISGAVLANICESCKQYAMRRDIDKNERTGVTSDDANVAVAGLYRQYHRSMNPSFDLLDFMERNSVNERHAEVDKILCCD